MILIRLFVIFLLFVRLFANTEKLTPILPDSGYRVHDKERPLPMKVSQTRFLPVSAPSDALVLFDGSDLDEWNGDWLIQNEVLIASKNDLITKKKFGACQFHLEYRIPKGRKVVGNNGLFVQEKGIDYSYEEGEKMPLVLFSSVLLSDIEKERVDELEMDILTTDIPIFKMGQAKEND